jgi:transposase
MAKNDHESASELASLREEIKQLREEKAKLQQEVEALRKFRRLDVPRQALSTQVKAGKTNKELARIFNVSERTISRRVNEYGLKGMRKRGARKQATRAEKKEQWVSVEKHFDALNRKYHFVNVLYPHTRYINPKTNVCSDAKENPRGSFTTVGIYYIAQNSGVHLMYRTRIRYSDEPVPFDEIYQWIKRNGKDILYNSWLENQLTVIDIVGYTFINPQDKPERVAMEGI